MVRILYTKEIAVDEKCFDHFKIAPQTIMFPLHHSSRRIPVFNNTGGMYVDDYKGTTTLFRQRVETLLPAV